jgi:phage tail protein X
MIRTYTTKPGDMIDEIVWRFYGRTAGVVEQVLEANREIRLSFQPPVLSAGLVITLPEVAEPEQETTKIVRLWQ